MGQIKKIAILTSGGDAPGMNAAIRSVVRSALSHDLEVYAVYDGYAGLIHDDIVQMHREDVTNISNRGGTILGTARLPEFKEDPVAEQGANNLKKRGIDAVVAIGGDGTYRGIQKLTKFGINVIGVPGTIDNDISSTSYTIGFDTAVNTALDAMDKLRDTSNSHNRCSIIEVMGRYCGDIAYAASVAGGCDMCINSETGYNEQDVIDFVKEAKKLNRRHLLICITEHITDVKALAKKVEVETGFDSRATIIGHIQRGGSPTAFDRVLATRLGAAAVEKLLEGVSGEVLGVYHNRIVTTPIEEALAKKKKSVFKNYAIDLLNEVR